jgi:retron-type reverse transcriptase
LQRALYLAISNLVAPHPLSHGFEKGRSIVTNAACHSYQPVVVRLDIRNAFNSTKKAFVIAALERDLEFLKLSARAFALLGEIFTLHDALPTGAPSSPFLLNRILFPVDCSIGDLAHFRDVKYSRYADDIVLSGVRATSLKHDVLKALKKLGYQLNEKKSRISRSGGRQMVTGLVVNSSPNLPREIRRNLRAATHSWARKGQATWKGDHLSEAQLIGHLSHYLMIDARSALALRNEIKI